MSDAKTMLELKPCPFCGGEAEIERRGDSRVSTQYSCTSCGCFLETGEKWGHGARWNTRAAAPSVPVEDVRQMSPEALAWANTQIERIEMFKAANPNWSEQFKALEDSPIGLDRLRAAGPSVPVVPQSAPVLTTAHNFGEGDPSVMPDCTGADTAAPSVPVEVIRLLNKISNLAYDEEVGEPLDDAIGNANKALAILAALPHQPPAAQTVREALELAEDVLSRSPFSTAIWPNGMHPQTGIEKIRAALAASDSGKDNVDESRPGEGNNG